MRGQARFILDSILKESSSSTEIYSDDYAGMYFDERGYLIICVTNEESKQSYLDLVTAYKTSSELNLLAQDIERSTIKNFNIKNIYDNFDRSICVDSRKYSYNDLVKAQSCISDKIDWSLITGVGFDQKLNKVSINVKTGKLSMVMLSIENILQEVNLTSDIIEYLESDTQRVALANQAWGCNVLDEKIFLIFNSAAGTIGFNAYDNDTGKYGIITNAHVVNAGTAYYSKNNKIGEPSKIVCNNFGNVDAAFIPFEKQDNWQPVRTLNVDGDDYRDRVSFTSDSYIQGDVVKNYGSKTGETYGVILKISVDIIFEYKPNQDRIIKDTVEYSNFCLGGDSGGPFGEGIPRVLAALCLRE